MLSAQDPVGVLAQGVLLALHRAPEIALPRVFPYLDPGTGSLMIQAVIAALITVPFLMRSKTRALIRRLRRGSPAAHPPEDPDRSS